MAQYSTKMNYAVLDVSLVMGLNIGETDKVFLHYINNNLETNSRSKRLTWSLRVDSH